MNAKVYVPSRAPPQRNVTVNTMATDEEGRCKSTTIELSNVEQESTIWSIKQMLGANELLSDVPPQRMSLSVYGAEAADGSRLREVSPTAHEVAMRLRVRRRGTAVPPPDALAAEGSGSPQKDAPSAGAPGGHAAAAAGARTKGAPAEASTAVSPPAAGGAAAATVDATASGDDAVDDGGALATLLVRTMSARGRSERLEEVHADMDVAVLRSRIAALPLIVRAWHEDPSQPTADDGKKGEGKAADKAHNTGADADLPPLEKLVLLGVGADLEPHESTAQQASPKRAAAAVGDDGGDNGGGDGDAGGADGGGDGGGGDGGGQHGEADGGGAGGSGDAQGTASASDAPGDGDAAPEDDSASGPRLVHLRDGCARPPETHARARGRRRCMRGPGSRARAQQRPVPRSMRDAHGAQPCATRPRSTSADLASRSRAGTAWESTPSPMGA